MTNGLISPLTEWHGSWKRSLFFLFGALLLATSAHLSSVQSMVITWWHSTAYQHCFFVPFIAGWLVWRRRENLIDFSPGYSFWGWIGLVFSGFISLIGMLSGTNLIAQSGFVFTIWSLFLLFLGGHITRYLWFPLLFLFFMVPIGDEFIPALQDITATISVFLLKLCGISIEQQGLYIKTDRSSFIIAEACAGLRFLIANIMIATLFAHLSFRNPLKWFAFLTISIIIPVIGNAIRAFGVMAIAHYSYNKYGVAFDHFVYGWGFFAVLMMINLWIGSKMADGIAGEDIMASLRRKGLKPKPLPAFTLPAVIAVIIAFPAYAWFIEKDQREFLQKAQTETIDLWDVFPSANIKNYAEDKISVFDAPAWQPRFKGADEELHSDWFNVPTADGIVKASVHVAYYHVQRGGHEALQPVNPYHDEEKWFFSESRKALFSAALPFGLKGINLWKITDASNESVWIGSFYKVNDRFMFKKSEAKSAHLYSSLLMRNYPAAEIAVAISSEHHLTENQARRIIHDLLQQVKQ